VNIGFHRLAIVDDNVSTNQPFILETPQSTVIFTCNGEIYNYKELIAKYNLPTTITNDCMVIPQLYLKMDGPAFEKCMTEEVKGEFAFLLFEFDAIHQLKHVMVARDTIGIRPLYYCPYQPGNHCLFFTSELKGGANYDGHLIEFPPGQMHTYYVDSLGVVGTYTCSIAKPLVPSYLSSPQQLFILDDTYYLSTVRSSVVASVTRRLSADKPFAFLLSGGVDSSLVAAISASLLKRPIRTFCCGMQGGTDLAYAKQVADHIGSEHTEVLFTAEEGLAAIEDVIRSIESWDTTTVRASVGQYLVSKHIGTKTDCRVVMVGEGPDEVCSSYLFNWYAPNATAMDETAKEYVRHIHYYDVKRADRCSARWGLEGRVPLLDPEFIAAYWAIPALYRMPTTKGMEKWWLRQAFANTDLLPDAVLWRKKEAFSDGVSSSETSWFQILQAYVETKVTDEEMANAATLYPFCTPMTKEAYYYRKVFCEIFGSHRQMVIPGYWQPKWTADGKEVQGYVDPSARTLDVYGA
jgi:asparagine synthase (glutamine-hydrolysing)